MALRVILGLVFAITLTGCFDGSSGANTAATSPGVSTISSAASAPTSAVPQPVVAPLVVNGTPSSAPVGTTGNSIITATAVSQTTPVSQNAAKVTSPPVVLWSTPNPIVYSTPLSAAQLNATASVPGKFVYSPPSGAVLSVGQQTLTGTFTASAGGASVSQSVMLTVNKPASVSAPPVTLQNSPPTQSGTSSPTPPVVVWGAPTSIVFGTTLSTVQLNATASVAGGFAYSPAVGTMLGAGSHTLTVTFTPAAAGASVSKSVMLTVNKATPMLNWTAPAPIVAGTALSAAQLDATAPTPGTYVYAPGSGTLAAVGTQTLTVTFTPTDAGDYNPAVATTQLTVNPQPVVLQLSAAAYTTQENAGWLNIPVIRTGSASGAVSVTYATANATAIAGHAYGAVTGTLSWSDGDATPKLIAIPILDQQLTTGSQTFTVNLSSPQGGSTLGSPASATVTAVNNDPQPTDYCNPTPPGSDSTATFCTTPNFPTYGTVALPLPANMSAQVGDGLQLASSSTNVFSMVMGTTTPGANMTTGQSVRSAFYMNYITGNLTQTLGSPIDTGQANNSTFAAVARHYAVGDPNDVHFMAADGLHLRALCSQNHSNCSPGQVWAGMIRVPAEIRPGMTVKVRYKSPAGMHSWAPIWLASGSEYSPGPGGNPYQGFGTDTALARLGSTGDFFEIDLNDNYPRWDNNPSVPMGQQLDYGIANIYGVAWKVSPHPVYWASGNGYSYQTASAPPFEQLPVNWSTGFHDLVLSWETDNLLYEFVDGKLVAASYMEYPASSYVDALAGGVTKLLAMNLLIGNQAIPSFTPGGTSATENDGIADGWTMVVQEISVWNGNIATPNSYQAAPNGCNAVCQTP